MTDFNTTEQTFDIPAENLPSFEAEMSKLLKRAKRLSMEGQLGYEVVRTYTKKGWYVDELGCKRECTLVRNELKVWGPVVKLDGWALVGRLDFKAIPGATLRMMVPGETCPPAFYDAESTRCDHCGHRRRRNDSFIVRNDDGREMVVGRTCLGDFLGHASPETLARMAELVMLARYASEESEGFGGSGGGASEQWNPTEVLALSFACIRMYGWAASKEEHPTKGAVLDVLAPARTVEAQADARKFRAESVTDRDWEKASEAIEWIANESVESSDYLSNLKATLTACVVRKTIGIAVSGAVAYDRHCENEIKRREREERKGDSGHVGAVKERLDFDAVVTMVRYTESYYGTTTVVKLRDDEGNVFTWFASGGKDIEQGGRYSVRGTVKKHDEYRGEKQTVITRCKLTKAA